MFYQALTDPKRLSKLVRSSELRAGRWRAKGVPAIVLSLAGLALSLGLAQALGHRVGRLGEGRRALEAPQPDRLEGES